MNISRVAIYCFVGGLSVTYAAMGTGGFGWWWLSGILLAAAFVPVAIHGPRGWLGQFRVIFPVLMIVSVVCLWSEGLIFVPKPEIQDHPIRNLISPAVLYAIMTLVLAALASGLKLTRAEGPSVEMKTPAKLALFILVSGLAYAVYYLIFGAITYQFFTKQYYPDATALVERVGVWFWPIQICRGALMALAVLPLIRTLRVSRLQAAIAVGMVIWVAGGLSPLVPPNPFMGDRQRIIHMVEIFTQNMPLGFTAVMLLRARKQTGSAQLSAAAAART